MSIDIITYDYLSRLNGKEIIVFGVDDNVKTMLDFIEKQKFNIKILFFLDYEAKDDFRGKAVYNVSDYTKNNDLSGQYILIGNKSEMNALNSLVYCNYKEALICSTPLYNLFNTKDESNTCQVEFESIPFEMTGNIPKINLLVTNAHMERENGISKSTVYEIADFWNQEYKIYRAPLPNIPVNLSDYSAKVPQKNLPLGTSHLHYLLHKRAPHVVQLSYNRRYIVSCRYNFFYLDIIDLETNTLIKWHDLPPSEGLWDYMATGDFDNNENAFYFCRWPLKDAIQGMADGTNRVQMQVGKLNLDTLKAEILHEFTFQDRVHQCTISGDGRYMVFAPMRVLVPKENPKYLEEEDVMSKAQKWAPLDSMATLDLHTKKVWTTEIPFPIPAHFELDPFDPHLFYVSTHSLMPHAGGVLCFQPATLHKLRIRDGESIIEATYTHPRFIRTIQHCPFVYKEKVYIAATNQNRVEIINADDMTLWYDYKLLDDPMYDNADFSNPEFSSKPFTLPAIAHHCNSISASNDGQYLILKMSDNMLIFDIEKREILGKININPNFTSITHARFYMQNAPHDLAVKYYTELMNENKAHTSK